MKIIALLAGAGLLLGVGCSDAPALLAEAGKQVPRAPGPDEMQKPSWSWPLALRDGKPPVIVRAFDPPARRWLPGHRGVDLGATPGVAVMAAGAGIVTFAGSLFGEDIVVVSHGGVRTSYEPVAAGAGIHVGQRVARGDVLGTLTTDSPAVVSDHTTDDWTSGTGGGTGSSGQRGDGAGTVLHWGLLAGHGRAVRYYDPLLLLGFGHLRLEPATGSVGSP
jgi:hypothetical protein